MIQEGVVKTGPTCLSDLGTWNDGEGEVVELNVVFWGHGVGAIRNSVLDSQV